MPTKTKGRPSAAMKEAMAAYAACEEQRKVKVEYCVHEQFTNVQSISPPKTVHTACTCMWLIIEISMHSTNIVF